MEEWEFKVKIHSREIEFRVVTIGMSFEDALSKAVRAMVEEGRPWGQTDVAEIWHRPLLGWLAPEERPLITFMPPSKLEDNKL